MNTPFSLWQNLAAVACRLAMCGAVLSAGAGSAPVAVPLGPLAQPFVAPTRIATDAAGRIYVSDSSAGRVTVLDAFNRLVQVKDGFAEPLGIAVGADGQIYLGEAGRGSVSVFNPDWQKLYELGAATGEFLVPGHIAVSAGPSGPTVYVSDPSAHQVKAYRGGALLWRAGGLGHGDGQFDAPTGLWVGPAGEVFVADQNNDRVQVLSATGEFLRAFTLRPPGVSTRSGRAQGLTGDPSGRIYVADTFQGFVKVYETGGAFLGRLGSYGEGAGQLLSPGGLAMAPGGRLWVASINTAQVQAYGLDCYLQLSAAPAVQAVAVGSTVSFTATPGCAGPFAFQWRKGTNDLTDGGVFSGTTSATLTIAGVTAGDAGVYSVVVSGPGGVVTSPGAVLNALAAPVITSYPTGRTVAQGSATSFVVVAQGESLTYQWFFDGIAVPGATGSSLTLTNVQPNAAGSYSVKVSNAGGSISSASAQLTVNVRPAFLLQPESQSVPERGVATFQVLASGTVPVRYQWYRNGSGLSGQTSTTLVLTNVTPAQAGTYTANAANVAGNVSSASAVLTVVPDTLPPQALSATGGRATNRTVLVAFSELVRPATAQVAGNYQVFGPGNRYVVSAVVTNGTNVLLTLNGPREGGVDYALRIRNVTDTALTPNPILPNPTTIPIVGTVDLMGLNTQPWKYFQTTNANGLNGTAWKLPTYVDSSWSNGFGIFWGHRSNSVYQPNPNPNVKLPVILNSAASDTTRAYTILNVFTNAGNVLQEITYYFRGYFNFQGETNGAALLLRSMVDDGAVFYLNGVELLRLRMAASPTTILAATLANAGGSQAWEPGFDAAPRLLPLTGLKRGTNVLAVEVHQNSTTSTDITFGTTLEATVTSFSAALPTLEVAPRLIDNTIILSWGNPFFILEGAADLVGPWTYVSNTSPVTVTQGDQQAAPVKFYRLRRQ